MGYNTLFLNKAWVLLWTDSEKGTGRMEDRREGREVEVDTQLSL